MSYDCHGSRRLYVVAGACPASIASERAAALRSALNEEPGT
jgi:hypothetical protein